MHGKAERLATSKAVQGVITAIPKYSGSQACSPHAGRQAACWKDRGDPSLAFTELSHGRVDSASRPRGDRALAPRGGAPAQGWLEKSGVILGHCRSSCSPPRRCPCKKGPLTPTSLEIWAPGSQPPRASSHCLVLPFGLQPQCLWKLWEGLGSFGRGG